ENARLLSELRERTEQLEVQSREVDKRNRELEQRVADQVGEIEPRGSACGPSRHCPESKRCRLPGGKRT
ncbi:MAG: hypothetical protein AB7F22_28670, partial [Reyranella sp.]|uniref:hypothetical protein n=1 Tax=Reyranella sp. TaxID=1929291 RepID=UPI003D14DBF5